MHEGPLAGDWPPVDMHAWFLCSLGVRASSLQQAPEPYQHVDS